MLHPSCCQRPHTLQVSSLGEAAEVVEAPPTWKVPLLPPIHPGKALHSGESIRCHVLPMVIRGICLYTLNRLSSEGFKSP